jgi:hypothetical protein
MEKKQHPFDVFLKEALKGHQLVPRVEARKAFLEEAATIQPLRRGWFRWYYLPFMMLVISGIVAIFVYNGDDHELSVEAFNTDTAALPDENTMSADNLNLSSTAATFTTSSASTTSILNLSDEKQTEKPARSQAMEEVPAREPGPAFKEPAAVAEQAAVTEQYSAGNVQNIFDSTSLESPVFEPESVKPGNTRPEPAFFAGGYYLPEWMFNTIEGGKFVNNFGLDFTFYWGRTSIRTGAGISISKGITENAVEYNEFLGTYEKLDSITFIFNESTHDFSPNIHTSSENVWDSLSLYDSADVIKRYTYLQLPLILGFDFYERGRLTAGVRVGTIMSVMMKSQQLTGAYDPGANQVIGVNKLSPDQVSVNWQAVGGINGSLVLTKQVFLEIEPQVKYYYQSIYERSGYAKKPWSLGLRTALMFKF